MNQLQKKPNGLKNNKQRPQVLYFAFLLAKLLINHRLDILSIIQTLICDFLGKRNHYPNELTHYMLYIR